MKKKLALSKIVDARFNVVEMVEEPYEDLKNRQKELMIKWEVNSNIVINLRDAVNRKLLFD